MCEVWWEMGNLFADYKLCLHDKLYLYFSASKLENADSALSIFENLKKGNKLTHTNVDILLECLWWMHRKDLIRKLGFDPKEVEPFISGLNQILPFRLAFAFSEQVIMHAAFI